MMTQSNPHLSQRLAALQRALMAQHAGGRGVSSAQAGSERETIIRQFLQRVFPDHRRFSTGTVIDSAGRISGQVDVAVEYGFLPSFPLVATEERLLLAESVAVVIEVKSNLSGQWAQVRDTTRAVHSLTPKRKPIMSLGSVPPERISVIAVGYKGYKTVARLRRRLDNTPGDEKPDAALVIESGAFHGFGVTSEGPLGLYALCVVIDRLLNALVLAKPDLMSYVSPKVDAP